MTPSPDPASRTLQAAAQADGMRSRSRYLDALLRPFRTPASAFGSSIVPPPLAMLELGIFAFVVFLEWQVDAFPDISRFSPHPYWLAILLLSLQYGTISGLIAAAVAILGAVLIGLPPADVEERYFNYLLRVWSEPILWLLIALLLGTFRTRQIEKVRWLVGEARDLEARGAAVVAHAANLKTRIDMLERRLAVRDTAPQGRLLSALARVSAHEPGRWVDDFATVADLAFPGAALTLYAVDDTGLHAVMRHRWPADTPWRQDMPLSDPLAEAVVVHRRTLSVAERADETTLGGDGLVAVPVVATLSACTTIVGMLKLESAPASLLDEDTAARLAVVASHVAPALAHGRLQLVPAASDPASDSTVRPAARLAHVRALRWLVGGRDGAARNGGDRDDRS